MLTGVETGLRKRRKVQPQKAHQRRVIRVSETFDRKSKQRGRWPVPATAGCCAAKVHWTVCLSLATLTGAVAKRLGLGSLSPQTRKGSDAAEPFLVCGDGRTRTAVQTPHQRAFYTLSLPLVFDERLPGDRLSCAYPLNLNGA